MHKTKKVIWSIIFVLPFIIGIIGYCNEGENLFDAAYYSFALYFVNPVSDSVNIFIKIARWIAPAVLASSLVLLVKELFQQFADFFTCLKKDAFVIYGDNKNSQTLKKNSKNSVIIKNNKVKSVKNHVIMFDDDTACFDFYNEHKEEFHGKNVYIKSNDIEMFRNKNPDYNIFNLDEIIARNYWVDFNLSTHFTLDKQKLNIAIIGSNSLCQKITDYAILNNIYSLNQQITYHIWVSDELYASLRAKLNLANNDIIEIHRDRWQNNIHTYNFDRIIFTDTPDINSLILLSETADGCEIDCYNLNEYLISISNNKNIRTFGQTENILTSENIFLNDIYYSAKLLNYKYACLYGNLVGGSKEENIENEWKKLDAFTKNSNISACCYHSIRRLITKDTIMTETELAEMEHIRWCRFHFINHWKAGSTSNGKKDAINKTHPCLVPFELLSDVDKQKDIEAINVLNDALK